jgi:hypothetical protein
VAKDVFVSGVAQSSLQTDVFAHRQLVCCPMLVLGQPVIYARWHLVTVVQRLSCHWL